MVLLGLGAVLISAVMIIDFWLGGQVAVSLGVAPIILLGLAARRSIIVLVLATFGALACFVLAVVGIQVGSEPAAIVNRSIALVLIWVLAALIYYARRSPPAENTTHELLDKDDLFQAVFNQTFQFVAALDSKGNIIEANETLRDYAGVTTNEIRSLAVWMLPIFRNDATIQEQLQSAILSAAQGNFLRAEFTVSGIGDQPTIIDLSLKPIRDDEGNIRHIVMEARDITEARIQQEMLVQAQKMEAVGELTAGVAHDFNNLLTVVVGNLELLGKRIDGNDGAHDRLDRAVKAAFRGQALTQQLLAFSRRQSLNPTVIDVNTLLRGMSQMYESLGEELTVDFDLADDLPPCEVDPTLLETALLNIAINARDAMPDGGVLRFQTSSAVLDKAYYGEVSDLPPGIYICLAISDTGEGISEEIVSQVFDPFFTTKSEGQGTGLGLSMVYGFVKQSGGDVKIYSERNEGTTIRLFLPATDKPLPVAAASENTDGSDDGTPGKYVLLVDDDAEVRDVILNALQEVGCDVETAENGDRAIELIRAGNEYDLVLTDMVMEGQTGGPDVARAARAASPNVPVIFCSGFPRDKLEGEEASMEGAFFLSKPFHQKELVEIVQRAFARRIPR